MNKQTILGGEYLVSRNRYLGIFAGCVIALLFPSVSEARSGWEYRVVNAGVGTRQLEALLNTNGQSGWELVQINNQGVAIFKRRR